VDIGYEIKNRLKTDLGEWVTCNVGIGPNRFLAKTAAGLHKPDGLDVIRADDILSTYRQLELLDLCGINVRYGARLNASGIFTPEQFLNAPLRLLKKEVFHSIAGYYWYLRLRGWEIDAVDFGRKSFGNQYALEQRTNRKEDLAQLIMKLCEKTGRRLREHCSVATSASLYFRFSDGSYFAKSRRLASPAGSTQDIYLAMMRLMQAVNLKTVSHVAITVGDLRPHNPEQVELFSQEHSHNKRLSEALDVVNDRYGEFTLTPALTMSMDNKILDRIAFGSVK
jgi:DNA polymerase IV